MNEDIAKEEPRKRTAEESLSLSVLHLPAELLSMVLAHLMDAKDIVSVHLVNSKFNECASWDGVIGLCFFIQRHSKGGRLSMRSATARLCFELGCLQDGTLRSFWKNCEKLEEITISCAYSWSLVSSADVHRLLSEIRSLQQEMPRKIKSLTNQCFLMS